MSLIGTLSSGISALRSFTKDLEVIGNNIANVNTVGFKSSTTSFADSFSNTLRVSSPSSAGTSNVSAIQVGTGVRVSGISTNFGQGGMNPTGVGTDLAVSGNGFFRVVAPDGTEYATRSGNFRWDDNGNLVTSQGYFVQGLSGGTPPTTVGNIKLATPPAGTQLQSYSFDSKGQLTEFYSDGTSAITNQVLLQNYSDPSALVKKGDNLFTGFSAAGPIGGLALTASNAPGSNGLGYIQGSTLELSNVDLTGEFANMISTQRSFQASSRLITVSDQVLEEIVNLKR
ncbi:flagellar hook-basal body protein [Opitutaceae bacterium EW11]|nr:flagellar hook-basal body protein [Opitutaceae bacterium EW11]